MMCLAAARWKVFWKKCLLMCCAWGASLRSTLWTHYQTDRWRLLMLIGAFDFGINCMKVSIDSESSKQSLQHTSEAEWAEKVEGKLRSGIRWLNQILLVVRFKALGNFSVWKRQRITLNCGPCFDLLHKNTAKATPGTGCGHYSLMNSIPW